MLPLVDALDHFLEAARKVNKQRSLKPIQRKLERAMGRAFDIQGKAFLKAFSRLESDWAVTEAFRPYLSEAVSEDDLDPILDTSHKASLGAFLEPIQEAAQAALLAGSKSVLSQLGYRLSFGLKNPRAVGYLKAHGAELVKEISETTRADMKTVVQYAVEHGWSYNKTAASIQARFKGYYDTGSWWNFDAPRPQGHIDSRAHLIAVTESGNAYEYGNFAVIEDLTDGGLRMEKAWSTMKDSKVSQGCRDNEAEGWIPADQEHASGHMHPLRFPGCRCDELYRAKE